MIACFLFQTFSGSVTLAEFQARENFMDANGNWGGLTIFFRISMQFFYTYGTYALIRFTDKMQLDCVFCRVSSSTGCRRSDSLCLLGRQPWRVWLKLLGLMASENDWYPLDTPRHCRWVFELKSLVYTSLTGFGWFRCSSVGIGSIFNSAGSRSWRSLKPVVLIHPNLWPWRSDGGMV